MVAAEGHDFEIFYFDDFPLPLFDSDEEAKTGIPENVHRLKQAVREADAIILASPEYNGSITPLLKNAIDWVSRTSARLQVTDEWKGKPVGLCSCSPGAMAGLRGLYHVRDIMVECGGLVISEQVSVGKAFEAFNEDGNLVDERTSGFLKAMISKLLEVSQALKKA
jgi:NAD(P)H-dependent FMN reductase